MNYDELVKLWQQQRDQYQLWELQIFQAAKSLCNNVVDALGISENERIDPTTKKNYRRVALMDIYKKSKAEHKSLGEDSFTSRGELVFGVGILLEPFGLENAFPKNIYYLPVAIRFFDKKIEYTFFDTKNDSAESTWCSDSRVFAGEIIGRLAENFRCDPRDGFSGGSKIGFV